jgi:hypothetical protein
MAETKLTEERRSVNNTGFLISKELLTNIKAQNFSQINSIKTYDFSTLYITIPHHKLKSRLLDIMTIVSLTKWEKEIFILSIDQSPETLLC